ncbi:hypothetical protein DH2020_014476 [Rehmannia glutinosa]|uniref:Endonuclease/exonuclease/phosphatase domain-containing protein n=1 Tax=Rehmannia glutinosa TaxID=99300 RepID=A0ABR0WXX6_REHGL
MSNSFILLTNHLLALLEPMTTPNFPNFCKKLGFQEDCAQDIELKCSSALIPYPFHGSFVYAKSTRTDRRTLWNDMRMSAASNDHLPWIVGGDFNCFLSLDERIGSHTDRTLDMKEFGQMVSDTALIDMGYEGDIQYIWSRSALKERLDRIFVNNVWSDAFPKSTVNHLPRLKSDHSPLFFKACLTLVKPPASFRYMNMWARHHNFLNNVAEVWNCPTSFYGLTNLSHKLIRVK